MNSGSDIRQSTTPVGTDFERGAGRLREAISGVHEPDAGFPAQVEKALRTTLALFAADPALARLLAIRPCGVDREAIQYCQGELRRYGGLLRRAAASDPEASISPVFIEPALIGGIAWQIARRLLGEEAGPLEDLLPSLLEFVLLYYFEPEERVQRTRAILDSEGGASP